MRFYARGGSAHNYVSLDFSLPSHSLPLPLSCFTLSRSLSLPLLFFLFLSVILLADILFAFPSFIMLLHSVLSVHGEFVLSSLFCYAAFFPLFQQCSQSFLISVFFLFCSLFSSFSLYFYFYLYLYSISAATISALRRAVV